MNPQTPRTPRLARAARPLAAAAAALLIGAGAQAQTSTAPATGTATTASPAAAKLDRGDRKFAENAAMGGLMEVQLGQLAQQKAADPKVKQFGARMVQDHGKANDELKQIAGGKSLALPTAMGKSHGGDVQKLEKLSGAEFDRAYMKHMVDDHKKDVAAFEKQAKSGQDADLKAFAMKTLPTLREHLTLAQSTYDAVRTAK